MRISRLRLQHFRTYDDLALEFGPGINVLFGKNGQGKTNVIEAIYLATCARSHRHASDQDMIQFGEDYYDVRLDFLPQSTYEESLWLQFFLAKRGDPRRKTNKRMVFHDGLQLPRISDLPGIFNAVMFAPEDLMMIKEGPATRRQFLDLLLSQVRPSYFRALQGFTKHLRQRNALLKQIRDQEFQSKRSPSLSKEDAQAIEKLMDRSGDGSSDDSDDSSDGSSDSSSDTSINASPDDSSEEANNDGQEASFDASSLSLPNPQYLQLETWTNMYATFAAQIILDRRRYVERLEKAAQAFHYEMSNHTETLELRYKTVSGLKEDASLEEIKEHLLQRLKRYERDDIERGSTSTGPHRDDLEFRLNGRLLKVFGSQGQQRSAVLSLKMAELEIIKEDTGRTPVLLLDDVLSELDAWRRQALIKAMTDAQVFITCKDPEEISSEWTELDPERDFRFYHVTMGDVEEVEDWSDGFLLKKDKEFNDEKLSDDEFDDASLDDDEILLMRTIIRTLMS